MPSPSYAQRTKYNKHNFALRRATVVTGRFCTWEAAKIGQLVQRYIYFSNFLGLRMHGAIKRIPDYTVGWLRLLLTFCASKIWSFCPSTGFPVRSTLQMYVPLIFRIKYSSLFRPAVDAEAADASHSQMSCVVAFVRESPGGQGIWNVSYILVTMSKQSIVIQTQFLEF